MDNPRVARKIVGKRRRMNGSLEEAPPLGESAPLGFDEPLPPSADSPPSSANVSEPVDPRAPRLAAAQSGAAETPRDSQPRNGPSDPTPSVDPPKAIPVGSAAPAVPQALPATSIEMRIRRLEDALAQLQQRRAAEMHVMALPGRPAVSAPPAADAPAQAPTDRLWDLGKRVLASPVAAARSLVAPAGSGERRHPVLLSEALAEARAILRMFTDPRYRLTWTGRLAPPLLLFLIVVSWWWVPFTSIVIFGNLLNKAVDLLLAYILFKVLAHEARRYRELAPDLPPSLRL